METFLRALQLFYYLAPIPAAIGYFVLRTKRIKWKYPPKERSVQFIFSFICFFYSGILILPLGPILLLTAIPSLLRLICVGLIGLLFLFSTVSLIRPKFTFILPILFVTIVSLIEYENPNRIRSSPYVDMCNDLRKNDHCIEYEEGFRCSIKSKIIPKFTPRERCINNVGNSDYDFVSASSPLIGKEVVTKVPAVYVKNLPRNNCFNRICGQKHEITLNTVDYTSSDLADPYSLSSKIRLEYIPKGSRFRIIDAFEIVSKELFSDQKYFHLVLSNDMNRKVEIRNYTFSRIFEKSNSLNQNLLKFIETHLGKIESEGYTKLKVIEKFENNSFGGGLEKFVKDFSFEDEIEINPPSDEADLKHTYEVVVKAEAALLNLKLIAHHWNIDVIQE